MEKASSDVQFFPPLLFLFYASSSSSSTMYDVSGRGSMIDGARWLELSAAKCSGTSQGVRERIGYVTPSMIMNVCFHLLYRVKFSSSFFIWKIVTRLCLVGDSDKEKQGAEPGSTRGTNSSG